MSDLKPVYLKARRHLARRDPALKQLIATVGPCTLAPDRADPFGLLARSIISQQISGKAARSIADRLLQALGKKGLTPAGIRAASDELLRGAGLSANKARSLRDLADHVHDDRLPIHDLHDLEDEAVIDHLVPVRGIGRWTAQMFLIFALGRLDVLPVDDYGLRAGVKRIYELEDLPGRKDLEARGEPWRPYRSVATWYFWRSFGAVPQSK